jgi:hypothetical protein
MCAFAAEDALKAGYLDMRRAGLVGGKRVITATTRQLESLIRLSEAHARMRLAPEVRPSLARWRRGGGAAKRGDGAAAAALCVVVRCGAHSSHSRTRALFTLRRAHSRPPARR